MPRHSSEVENGQLVPLDPRAILHFRLAGTGRLKGPYRVERLSLVSDPPMTHNLSTVASPSGFGGAVVPLRGRLAASSASARVGEMAITTSELDLRARARAIRASIRTDRIQVIAILATDLLLVTLSTLLAIFGRSALPLSSGAADLEAVVRPIAFSILLAWLVLMALFGVYSPSNLGAGTLEYKRVLLASFSMAATLGISCYLFQYPLSRGFFVLLFAIGTPALVAGRFAMRRLMHSIRARGRLMAPVLIAGTEGHVEEIASVLRRERWLGYKVVGALLTSTNRHEVTRTGIPVVGRISDALEAAHEVDAEAVIFAEGSFPASSDFRRMAWDFEDANAKMIVVPSLTDVSAERLQIRPVAGLPLVHVEPPQAREASRWLKRTFDFLGAAFLLLLASPLFAAVALAIKLDDGGPVFFKQVRAGRDSRPFHCLKFRSMSLDAEARLAQLQAHNQGNGVLFKMAKDPRITRVGRFIRRFSIDEVPQFINVLRGEMSLVGPRPALLTEVANYEADVHRRLHVRPGLTGLWQVSGRSDLSWEDTVRLDLYYVDNWSIVQDLTIMARTFWAVVRPRGAY